MAKAAVKRPYKFLSPYELKDEARFFGRDVETDVLLADVVVNRLVVLFARTGTGKTSLINAGVRPRLKQRGFATYVVRTRPDPIESARVDLARDARGKFPTNGSLAEQLRGLAKALRRPVVVFFDQFEEFFLYVLSDDVERADAFVAEVAELYEDEDSGVHLVFSLREEWFVDMGFFADRIPEIFQSDANLRLRWFDIDQARAAIVGPVGESAMTPALVDRLLSELVETGQAVAGKPSPGAIEPAQLQIVCDTLWRDRANGRLDLDDYEALARPGSDGTVARQVLDRRLVEEFEVFHRREELDLLAVLLPELATKDRTKRVREYGDLMASVSAAPGLAKGSSLLPEMLSRLRDARLVDIVPRGSVELVELTHDYLVLHLDDLLTAISRIWPRRTLENGVRAWRRNRLLLASDVLPELVDHVAVLPLDKESAELLLRSCLVNLLDLGPILPFVEPTGAPVWEIIAERVQHGSEAERTRAIESLAQLGTPAAYDVLRAALDDRTSAPQVIAELAQTRQPAAVDLLERATARQESAAEARAALAKLADSLTDPHVARLASGALSRSLAELSPEEVVPALVELDARIAAELLDGRGGPDAQEGLITLATAKRASPARSEARRRVLDRVERNLDAGHIGSGVIDALGEIEYVRSAELLGLIAQQPQHRPNAVPALEALKRSTISDVAAAAARELDRLAGETVPEPAPVLPLPASFQRDPDSLAGHFAAMVQLLAAGRLVPFLGAGSAMLNRREGEPWRLGETLPSGPELSRHLISQVGYPPSEFEGDFPRVAQYAEMAVGRHVLQSIVHEALAVPFVEPTSLDRLLARVIASAPQREQTARPLIVSLRFDDQLERSFQWQGRECAVLTYLGGPPGAGRFSYQRPGEASIDVSDGMIEEDGLPLILKLFGGIADDSDDDSLVITEDDQIDHAINLAQPGFLPPSVQYALHRSSFLFLGYSLRDWSLRLLLRSFGRGLDVPSRRRSWAVMRDPSSIDVELWRARDIDVIDLSLDEYADRLEDALARLDFGTLPS